MKPAEIGRPNLVRVIRWIGELLVLLTAIIAIAWAFGAVWFDAPFGNANKVVAGLLVIASAAALKLKRLPNSVDTLAPNNRFVVAINKIPMTKTIPYHSIIGDRGRGDSPNSSDGVVAYWSSHLDGARSERIVPSGHGSPLNPQAIAEVHRILQLNEQSH